jgi:ubiquinone/menaquinone biosynthesis C-methylase UbiE
VDSTRFARFVTTTVVRRPWLWRLFRRPLARMFDSLAPTWETRVSAVHLEPLVAALRHVDEPARVLDLGTGTGAAARLLVSRYPAAEVTGADMSPEMVRQAQARATTERYVVADASALPFADDSFDLVTLVNMIPFYDELARVTAPGGTVVLAYSRGAATPIYTPFERSRRELGRRGFEGFAEVARGAGTALLARLHS